MHSEQFTIIDEIANQFDEVEYELEHRYVIFYDQKSDLLTAVVCRVADDDTVNFRVAIIFYDQKSDLLTAVVCRVADDDTFHFHVTKMHSSTDEELRKIAEQCMMADSDTLTNDWIEKNLGDDIV